LTVQKAVEKVRQRAMHNQSQMHTKPVQQLTAPVTGHGSALATTRNESKLNLNEFASYTSADSEPHIVKRKPQTDVAPAVKVEDNQPVNLPTPQSIVLRYK
jgi:hypothetical protein